MTLSRACDFRIGATASEGGHKSAFVLEPAPGSNAERGEHVGARHNPATPACATLGAEEGIAEPSVAAAVHAVRSMPAASAQSHGQEIVAAADRLWYRGAVVKTCGGCGVVFDLLQGKYAPNGDIVCVACGDKLAVAAKAAEQHRLSGAFIGSIGALLLGVFSFVVQYRISFLLAPLLAIVGGFGCAWTALKNPKAILALGKKRIPTIAIGLLAALIGVLSLSLNIWIRLD